MLGHLQFPFLLLIFVIFICLFFKTGFHYVALASLEITMKTRLASNSETICFCFLSGVIKGVYHHASLEFLMKLNKSHEIINEEKDIYILLHFVIRII